MLCLGLFSSHHSEETEKPLEKVLALGYRKHIVKRLHFTLFQEMTRKLKPFPF